AAVVEREGGGEDRVASHHQRDEHHQRQVECSHPNLWFDRSSVRQLGSPICPSAVALTTDLRLGSLAGGQQAIQIGSASRCSRIRKPSQLSDVWRGEIQPDIRPFNRQSSIVPKIGTKRPVVV